MKVIGLTGGVGSGKSLAAQIIKEECQAELLIADHLGYLAMQQGTDGYQQIVNRFGDKYINQDGSLKRKLLADLVFQDDQARKDLNRIVHPIVKEYILEYIQKRKNEDGIIVLESAILFESECDALCDRIWYIHVSDRLRRQRLYEDRGYTEEEADLIMSKQLSEPEFFRRCDLMIENNDTEEDLIEKIRIALQKEGIMLDT